MIYKKYGTTFKEMRKQNGFTLADFSLVGLPTSTLSDFERGKSMISLDKVNSALQLMGYSLSDFDAHLNYYSPTDPVYILQEVEKAILSNDSHRLEELLEACQVTNQRYVCITIKILLKKGTNEEKNDLINFLYETKIFGIKELTIFIAIMCQLAPQDIINIMDRIKKYAKGMSGSENYHRHLSLVILEVIVILSKYGLKDKSQYYIRRIRELNLAQTMFLNNFFHGVEGYWIYCFEDKLKGRKQVLKFLEVQHLTGQPEQAKFFQEQFNNLMDLQD